MIPSSSCCGVCRMDVDFAPVSARACIDISWECFKLA